MSNYLTVVVLEGMRNSASRRPPHQLASPSDKRVTDAVQTWLTPSEKRKLEARAQVEGRTPSNYV
jgi:hypothetical protein